MPSIASALVSALALGASMAQSLPYESISSSLDTRDTSDPIRGVNIGGWLVLEGYMNWAVMSGTNAVDQWTFDVTNGAQAKLQSHWATWFTEADVEQIAAWGLNTLRIPIGFWAYNNTGTPYIQGADDYLKKALGWCRNHGLKVLICAHGLPGSQNGFDNSGHGGQANWLGSDNMATSLSVLEAIVKKYGTAAYSDVVFGLEIVNEPIVWDTPSAQKVSSWVKTTFNALQGLAGNKNLKIIMHDAFIGARNWETVGAALNQDCAEPSFYLDLHLYQNQDAADSQLSQTQHIAKTCNYPTTTLLPNSTTLPIIVGEFTDQTNVCVDAHGVVTAGTSCSTAGCQCSANTDTSKWNGYLVNATRLFLETQLDVFEENTEGWFIWSYTGPGAWGLQNLFRYGVIGPNKVTDRKFPPSC